MAKNEFSNLSIANRSGVVGYWKLENVNDSSASGYNLTNNGTATFSSAVFNNGVALNGSNQSLSIADASCPNLEISGSQSWSCWIKATDLPAADVYTILGKANASSGSAQHRLYLNTTGTIGFDLEGTSTGFITSTATVTAGAWTHICGVYDSTAGLLYVYINGVPKSVSNTGTVSDSNANFAIGCEFSGGSDAANRFFKGMIDDVAIMNFAISAEQVREIYEGRSIGELWPQTNVQGLWHLSNTSDSSGNGYNLNNVNTATFPVGKFGNCVNLVASSVQYLDIADASCANLEISGSQTWMCWTKFNTATGLRGIMCKANSKRLWTNNSVFTFDMPGLTTNTTVTSSVTPTTGVWYFVAGVYDSTAQKLKIWINTTKSEVSASGSATDTNGAFLIGNQEAHNIPFDGQIDEAVIFNKALSDNEIRNYYSWSIGRMARIL